METIIVTPEELEMMLTLRKAKAMSVQFGKITINVAHGIPQNVILEEMTYARKFA